MSIYRCSRCDRNRDKDYDACTPDPKNELELMCEQCTADVEEESADRRGIDGNLKADQARGSFAKDQQETIDYIKAHAQEPS